MRKSEMLSDMMRRVQLLQRCARGTPHPNGGGFVANGATVEKTAYVGPNAQVLGRAKVLGNARVEDQAVIRDSATVQDNAVVSGHAVVSGGATIRDQAKLRDYAAAEGRATVRGSARILEHGRAMGNLNDLSGTATLKGLAWAGGQITGSAVVGGSYDLWTVVSRPPGRVCALFGRFGQSLQAATVLHQALGIDQRARWNAGLSVRWRLGRYARRFPG